MHIQVLDIDRRVEELIVLDRAHKAVLFHLLILDLDPFPQIRKKVHNDPRVDLNEENNQEEDVEEIPEDPEVVDPQKAWGDLPPD